MSGHKLLQRAAVKLAARGLKLSREAFGLLEYIVRDGDRRFHTLSITQQPARL
jgi:hypothetical protein